MERNVRLAVAPRLLSFLMAGASTSSLVCVTTSGSTLQVLLKTQELESTVDYQLMFFKEIYGAES